MSGYVCVQCRAPGAGSGFCGMCGARNWMAAPPAPTPAARVATTAFVCGACGEVGAGSGYCGMCGAKNWVPASSWTAVQARSDARAAQAREAQASREAAARESAAARAQEEARLAAALVADAEATAGAGDDKADLPSSEERPPSPDGADSVDDVPALVAPSSEGSGELPAEPVAEGTGSDDGLAAAELVLETPEHPPTSVAQPVVAPGSRLVSRAALPNSLQQIRAFGDLGNEYWCPAYDDDGRLVLEPGEELLWTKPSRVDGHGTQSPLPGAVAVTNKRVVWACTGFDKGGGWVGFGVVGLTVATTANVMSKRAAKRRSEGRVLAGHARFEWLVSVAEQSITRSYASMPERRVVLACAGQPKGAAAILYDAAGSSGMAAWIAQVAVAHRTGYVDVLSADDAGALGEVAPASLGKLAGPKGGDWTMWRIPGDQGLLISAAYADLMTSRGR